MRLTQLAVLAALTSAIVVVGCSKSSPTAPTMKQRASSAPSDPAPGDTVPVSPTPPTGPVIQPALFLSYADSTVAGSTAQTQWRLDNDVDQPFTMHWTLTCDADWPGLPIEGTVDLAALSTQVITIPITVPTGTAPGMYGLKILVTRPGNLEYTTEGVVRVHS